MDQVALRGTRRRPGWSPDQRRRAALLAGSVVFHVAILTPLALRFFEEPLVPRPDEDPAIPIYLEIEPRPLLPGEVARTRVPVARPAGPVAPLDQVRAGQSILPGTQGRTEDTPSTPAPRIAAGAPTSAPTAPADAWRLTPESQSAAVARSLRTGAAGCRAMDGRLTPGEQQLCDDRFNAAAGRAGPLGPRTLTASEARREAQFARDGALAMAQYQARRTRRAGVGISGASPECVGGNLRGTCAGAYLEPQYQHSEEAPFGGTAAPK